MSSLGRCCLFRLGEANYFALPAGNVRQVISPEQVNPVPLAPPELKGLFVLRGAAVALIDLAALIGLPSSTARLALLLEQEHLAFTADEVIGFASPERLQLDATQPYELGSFHIEAHRFALLDDQLLMRGLEAAFGA